MEEDDDFGDLYTDVLRLSPVATNQKPPPVPPAAIATTAVTAVTPIFGSGSIASDVEENNILKRSPLLLAPVPESSSIHRERQVSVDDADDDWLLGREPPPVEEPVNWVDEDEDEVMVDRVSRDAVGGFPFKGGGSRVLDTKEPEADIKVSKEETDAFEGGGSIEKTLEIRDPEDEQVIPGLSGALFTSKVPNGGFAKASDSDDWDSGSEDDLQIVLNDTGHDMRGAERGDIGGSDEDDEDLVIVTDDQHHHHQALEEQDWGDDGVQSSFDGEKKEMLEGTKAIGVAPTASGTGLGYSNHGFHPQHHSMFKYVRPGATPTPRGSGMAAAGALGQVRPPAFGPLAGRGRGDWRPVGGIGFPNMQKGFHAGYGLPTWGNNAAGRPYGSGLDFFLPSHKTVFDVDIESFDEKPWRHPGVDISDFFNFGLDEEHWKEYCKQVEQLRLESTMQSKIRVYESGRSEQDYDPDLPPELAAATGHNNMSADNINIIKSENGPTGLSEQGGASICIRPMLPTGRAIQVESGFGERLPSIDTRAPRIRDSDAVIEIVLQDNLEDSKSSNGTFKRPENNFERENQEVFHNEDERPTESEFYGRFPHSSNVQQREAMALRIPISSEEDGILPLPSELSRPSNSSPKSRIPVDTANFFGNQHGGRLSQRTPHGKNSSASERLSETLPSRNVHLDKHEVLHKEKSSTAMEFNQDSELSPSNIVEMTRESSTEPKDIEHDDRLTLGDSHEGDGEEASDFRLSSETGGEDGLINSASRKKLSSCVEQYVAQDNGFDDDSRLTHSDNSRARSGNSRDYRKANETGEEVMQIYPSKHAGDLHKHFEEDDHRRREDYGRDGRRETIRDRSRGREVMHVSASGHTFRGRSEGFEREMDDSVGGWRRKEDDTRNNRQIKDSCKVRMTDKKEKIEEHGDWIGHSRDDGIRHRDRKDILMNRRDNLEDGEMKRKRDVEPKRDRADKEDSLRVYRAREDSRRRRRVREDIVDHRKREDEVRTKSNKHKDDNWYQRDREDRQQLNLTHDDSQALQGREERRFTSRSKILAGSGRTKEDLKVAGADKTYHNKDRRRHGEQSKRGDRTGEENETLNKVRGDTHNREKRFSAEKRSLRHERLTTRPDRPSGAYDEQQVQKERHQERHRESNRKVGESEPAGQKREVSSKRKRGDHNTHRAEFSSKGSNEQQNSKHSSTTEGKKVNGNAEDPASDDESDDSRRGRSKLERWTSHKERDYSINDNNIQPSSIIREVEDSREEVNELIKLDATEADSTETNPDDLLQIANKVGEDRDRHLDTVAKLKMRSERFKLPMPGEKEKDVTGNKKADSESPVCIQNEASCIASAEADVKLERPARKRKWTGS